MIMTLYKASVAPVKDKVLMTHRADARSRGQGEARECEVDTRRRIILGVKSVGEERDKSFARAFVPRVYTLATPYISNFFRIPSGKTRAYIREIVREMVSLRETLLRDTSLAKDEDAVFRETRRVT